MFEINKTQMKTKDQILLERAYASISGIFEAEGTPEVTETTGAAQETATPPVAELTPTEEQILTALIQKLGPEQFLAKVTQMAAPKQPQPAPAAPQPTPQPAPAA
jgi:hypothetical protein